VEKEADTQDFLMAFIALTYMGIIVT
jgi:hypothetical protein